jgi:hypothetical protein
MSTMSTTSNTSKAVTARMRAAAAAHFRSKPKADAVPAPTPPASQPQLSLPKLSLPRPLPPAPPPPVVAAPPAPVPPPASAPVAAAPKAKGPAVTPRKTWTDAELQEMLGWLKATWPRAFTEVPPRPLAIGVGMTFIAARPKGKTWSDVGAAVRLHTRSDAYLEAVAREGSHRFDLDGNDTGPVLERERAFARKCLARNADRRQTPNAGGKE